MPDCRYCGSRIVWLPVVEYDGGRPFDAMPINAEQEEVTLPRHHCVEYEQSRVQALREDQIKFARRAESNALVAEAAQEDKCSKCGAEPGIMCWNLLERRRGHDQHTVWPHKERLQPALARLIKEGKVDPIE